ncbi:DUF4192 domain-containing protein [Gordonia shandongensis]|uniref:DUF4192 domain-containing protein n=1 Tax=Gordonia shandongensis TaxID=376351 RepID=UPI00047EDB65|nr:DUF4192 domain-containing protein [Gordonia shandongensis]
MTNTQHVLRPDGTGGYHDPSPLLAAVPGLLGFLPERSVVLIAFRDARTITATMRHDLELTPDGSPAPTMRDLFDRLGALAADYGTVGTVAVFIDDRLVARSPRWRGTALAVDRAFRSAGGLSAAFAMTAADAGTPWRTVWVPGVDRTPGCPFPGAILAGGTLSDPNASPTALERAVASGRRILARRSEIAALLTREAHCDDPRSCHETVPEPTAHAPDVADARALASVLAVVDDFAAGHTDLTCDETNALADALVSVHVRDALLGLAVTGLRPSAEDLWRRLARRLSGHACAAAATLLGHLHYMAGEGVYASAAFDVARAADPDYGLVDLLDTALAHGMRPSSLIGLTEVAYAVANRLGVRLPPPVYEAA